MDEAENKANNTAFDEIERNLLRDISEKRENSKQDWYYILNACHVPAVKITTQDGEERYFCSICSTKGIIYGFDITQDGKLDAKLRPYSDDLRDFPLVTL